MNHLGDLLSAWLDGELESEARNQAARHLGECAACREELAVVEAARTAVRGLPLLDGIPVATPAHSRIRPRRLAWAAAATAAAVLAAGLWIGPGEPGSAFEMDVLDQQHTARVTGDPGISTFRGEQP
jgi:anti-sigma factor RsiW